MRILLMTLHHPPATCRNPDDVPAPSGIPVVGAPLADDGHDVDLLDAGPLPIATIVAEASRRAPDALLFGHSGSTSGHRIIADVSRALRAVLPEAWFLYGGAFPADHWREVLTAEPQIDIVVRDDGTETIRRVVAALERGVSVAGIPAIAWLHCGVPQATRQPGILEKDCRAPRSQG